MLSMVGDAHLASMPVLPLLADISCEVRSTGDMVALLEKAPALVNLALSFPENVSDAWAQVSLEGFTCLEKLDLVYIHTRMIIPSRIHTLCLKRVGRGAGLVYRAPENIEHVVLTHVYDQTTMDHIMAGICTMQNLASLEVDWCMWFTQSHVEALSKLLKLRRLSVGAPDRIQLSQMESLEEITVVDIGQLSSEFLYSIPRFANVRKIVISYGMMGQALLVSFLQGMDTLRELTLRTCPHINIEEVRSQFPGLLISE